MMLAGVIRTRCRPTGIKLAEHPARVVAPEMSIGRVFSASDPLKPPAFDGPAAHRTPIGYIQGKMFEFHEPPEITDAGRVAGKCFLPECVDGFSWDGAVKIGRCLRSR